MDESAVHAAANALWQHYGYAGYYGPWRLALTGASEKEGVARAKCFGAAKAVVEGLRHLPWVPGEDSGVPPIEVDIFTPIEVWADGSGTVALTDSGAGVVIHYHGAGPAGGAEGQMGETHGFGEYLGPGTNNFAELHAIRLGLEAIPEALRARPVVIHSDSEFALGAVSGRNRAGAHKDLILSIRGLIGTFRKVDYKHVKGHSGVLNNERADQLAGRARTAKRRIALEEVL